MLRCPFIICSIHYDTGWLSHTGGKFNLPSAHVALDLAEEPPRQRRARLMARPRPCQLDHGPAQPRRLPAFEVPCSRSTLPLAHGVGSSTANAATCRRLPNSRWKHSAGSKVGNSGPIERSRNICRAIAASRDAASFEAVVAVSDERTVSTQRPSLSSNETSNVAVSLGVAIAAV